MGEGDSNPSALRTVASVFGVLAGIGGITHGVGEVLQGNVAPDGIFFDSWVEGPIATGMGGDPAISLVPNLLVTGILTLVVSATIVVWAAAFVGRPRGGLVLVLLSVVLLLVGGGVGSPVVAFLAGLAGLGIGRSFEGFRSRLPGRVRTVLGRLWPWAFAIAASSGLFLFVGAVVLVYSVEITDSGLFLNAFYLTVVSLVVTVLAGAARDSERRGRIGAT